MQRRAKKRNGPRRDMNAWTGSFAMSKRPSSRQHPLVLDLRAELDPTLSAVLGPTFPLRYSRGGSVGDDHPAFLRAASAVRRWQQKRIVIQDDVSVLALGECAPDADLSPLLLPRGADGRRQFDDLIGNKRLKLDLEAAAVLPDGRLLVLGSGSLPERERLVVVEPGAAPTVRDARELYAALRREVAFSGSELNLEGALVSPRGLELFQRGNGAMSGSLRPVTAIGTLPLTAFLRWLDGPGPVPELTRIVRVELGRARGVPFSFTDATSRADGVIAFLACAEDSPDAVRDGEVLGCRFGLLDSGGVRVVDILNSQGEPCALKLEGIEAHPDDGSAYDVVADMDRPDTPALGAVLAVRLRKRDRERA